MKPGPHVALVTSVNFPKKNWIDRDLDLLNRSLQDCGVVTTIAAWDSEKSVQWNSFDAIVLQSPWSNWIFPSKFAQWLKKLSDQRLTIINPLSLVQAGLDKSYLLHLEAQGIPIVPTTYFSPRDLLTA